MVTYHWGPKLEFTWGSTPWICWEAKVMMMPHSYPPAPCSCKSPQCYTSILRKEGGISMINKVGCFLPSRWWVQGLVRREEARFSFHCKDGLPPTLPPSEALQAAGNIFACFSGEALFLRSWKDGSLIYWLLGVLFPSMRWLCSPAVQNMCV